MSTVSPEDLQKFLDKCKALEERGYTDAGVAYAVGFNDATTYRAFRAIIENNIYPIGCMINCDEDPAKRGYPGVWMFVETSRYTLKEIWRRVQ